jgi:uncharacterized protein (TIGR00269 family)
MFMVHICSKCSKHAITFIRYNGIHLCEDHFIQFVTRRVKKEMRKQGKVDSNSVIGIAISGGKDSVVVLQLMYDLYHKRKDITLIGISIDEGIIGYRNNSLLVAKKNCKNLGIDHIVVSFNKKIGMTMDEIIKMKDNTFGACSYCGVFRRFCLNTTAKQLKVDKLVTGHNLDDMAQSILMNFINADMKKISRLGPHIKVQPGLIPRMMPLRLIPEKENALLSLVKGFHIHNAICPYSADASRGYIKNMVYELEERNPGTRHSILKSYDTIKDTLSAMFPPSELRSCKTCGEPTMHFECKTCLLKKQLKINANNNTKYKY